MNVETLTSVQAQMMKASQQNDHLKFWALNVECLPESSQFDLAIFRPSLFEWVDFEARLTDVQLWYCIVMNWDQLT